MTFVRPAVSSFRIRWWTYKRLWRTGALVSFVQPVFTMLALGVGVGGLIVNRTSLGGLNYATFIGPGLLVSSCMMTGAVEGMWMVLDAFQWNRLYHSQVASPLTPRDVVRGHALWIIVEFFLWFMFRVSLGNF